MDHTHWDHLFSNHTRAVIIFSVLSLFKNNQDLSPNFAGTIYSVINTVGFTAGMLGPIVKNELKHLAEKVSI